jgi:hypothetical protein
MHTELVERWEGAEGGGHRGVDYEGVERSRGEPNDQASFARIL